MPKVFPIHEQLRRAPDGMMVLAHDTRAAERFGTRTKALFSDGASKVPVEDLVEIAEARLAEFEPEDFLICLGAPDLISLATLLAAKRLRFTGTLNLLIWNSKDVCYEAKSIPLERCNHV